MELKWVSAGLGASYTIIAYYVLASLKNALQMQAHNNVASVTWSWPRKLTDWCGSSIIFQCSVFSAFSLNDVLLTYCFSVSFSLRDLVVLSHSEIVSCGLVVVIHCLVVISLQCFSTCVCVCDL